MEQYLVLDKFNATGGGGTGQGTCRASDTSNAVSWQPVRQLNIEWAKMAAECSVNYSMNKLFFPINFFATGSFILARGRIFLCYNVNTTDLYQVTSWTFKIFYLSQTLSPINKSSCIMESVSQLRFPSLKLTSEMAISPRRRRLSEH